MQVAVAFLLIGIIIGAVSVLGYIVLGTGHMDSEDDKR